MSLTNTQMKNFYILCVFITGMFVSQRVSPNHFVDPLTFHLVLPAPTVCDYPLTYEHEHPSDGLA